MVSSDAPQGPGEPLLFRTSEGGSALFVFMSWVYLSMVLSWTQGFRRLGITIERDVVRQSSVQVLEYSKNPTAAKLLATAGGSRGLVECRRGQSPPLSEGVREDGSCNTWCHLQEPNANGIDLHHVVFCTCLIVPFLLLADALPQLLRTN